ncbi:MAG: nuclear transport factor 2 family protein [Actinobacteria bacterium]|nr:nuclear transport factor 2 family protein [Actinomycetota bacterium]
MTADSEIARIKTVLDGFHAAAVSADEAGYLALLSPDAVFLGTDGGERWAGEAYRAFIHSYFSRGIGWTYVPSKRSVGIAADGRTAWFDERLENESFGACRGTGVLQLRDGEWRVEQYNLTIPIPNELAGEVVARIREAE